MYDFTEKINKTIESVFKDIASLTDEEFNMELASLRDDDRTGAIFYALNHDDFWIGLNQTHVEHVDYECATDCGFELIHKTIFSSAYLIAPISEMVEFSGKWAKLLPGFYFSNLSKSFDKLDKGEYGKCVGSDDYEDYPFDLAA